MRDPLFRRHLKLTGTPDAAGAVLPLGVSKVRDLLREAKAAHTPHLTRYLVTPDALIESRTHGDQRYVNIVAQGCKDRRGFYLSRNTGTNEWFARYNDGVVEEIDPITGLPRPDPDPAVRTKDYVVPTQLQQSNKFTNTNAGKFSGLMRLVVGCHHIRGVDAPFGFAFARTHGIVKLTVMTGTPPSPSTRHWIVEVSSAGVFAARIVNKGSCCDSWSVAKYMPTDAEIEADPTLAQHRVLLSLEWAFSVQRPGVTQLVGSAGISAPYAGTEAPVYAACGWAFSASGAEAQNITFRSAGSGATFRYEFSRWKLAFSAVGDVLTCGLSAEDTGEPAVFVTNSTLWSPSGVGTWSGLTTFADTSDNVAIHFPVQDAPVHVYYDGETPVVTRWKLTRVTHPAEGSTRFSVSGTGLFTAASGAATILYGGSWSAVPLSWLDIQAGFESPKISTVSSRTQLKTSQTGTTVVGSPVSTQHVIQVGTPNITATLVSVAVSEDRLLIIDEDTNAASFATFIEDREAILNVRADFNVKETTPSHSPIGPGVPYTAVATGARIAVSYTRDDDGTPVLVFPTLAGLAGNPAVPEFYFLTGDTSSTGSTSTVETRTGSAQLNAGSVQVVVNIPQGSPPSWTPPANELMEFIAATPALSNVFAQHGNLYYDDPKIKPKNQAGNAVYLLEPSTIVALGGFMAHPAAETLLAFVGKA